MIEVGIAKNIAEPETWEWVDVDNIHAFLMQEFPDGFPKTARIYHRHISQATDITPSSKETIKALGEITEGPIFVVVYPGFWFVIVAIVAIVISIAATFLLMPKTPKGSTSNTSQNNALTDHQNVARLNSRIPDIVGTVRSTPDLVAVPYRMFETGIEVEVCYMCIGRGSHVITDIRNDTTLLSQILGESAEVYAPFTSPNSGDAPQIQIGDPIDEPVCNIKQVAGINGQTLWAPNYNYLDGTEDSFIEYASFGDGTYGLLSNDTTDHPLQGRWELGDTLNITDHTFTSGGYSFNPTGVYTCVYVDAGKMIFADPVSINPDWANLAHWSGGHTAGSSPVIDANPNINGWTQPLVINAPDAGFLICNVVAPSGAYTVYKGNQFGEEVDYMFGVTPCDDLGVPTGSEQYFSDSLRGSRISKNIIGKTTQIPITTTGSLSIRARRTSNMDKDDQVEDSSTIQWRDLYVASSNTQHDFGDVTTVFTKTKATPSALSQQTRKLNMLAQRMVPQRISGNTFTTELFGSDSADDIICFLITDKFNGNRPITEADCDNIYSTVDAVKTLFGWDPCGQFCYTFDDADMSFEEEIAAIALAIFCTAYRFGSMIRIVFEQQTEDSGLLFSHRSKIPKSETRSYTFGTTNNNDGVEFDWVDPNNYDQTTTLYVPPDMSAVNAQKITGVGVRDKLQAHFYAYRLYNKMLYGWIGTEFEATQQADLLVLTNRIRVTDNTRQDTQDGEVIGVEMLEVELSQDVTLDPAKAYMIWLQHDDASVEGIDIIAGSAANKVVLATPPRRPLAFGDALYKPAGYDIVSSDERSARAFLVTGKEPANVMTFKMTAIIYDDRYYGNDLDYINGNIDPGGVFTDKGIAGGSAPPSVGGGESTSTSFLDRYIFF